MKPPERSRGSDGRTSEPRLRRERAASCWPWLELVVPVALALVVWFTTFRGLVESDNFRWFGDLVIAHDFAQHHAAGWLWRNGGPEQVYRPGALGQALLALHGEARSTRLFAEAGYLYPPPVGWAASVFCPLDYRSAVFGFWILTGLAALFSVFWLTFLLRCQGRDRWVTVIWGLSFPSFLAAFLYGQPSALGLLAVVGACWASSRDRPWFTGFFLAFLAIKPTWFLALLPVLWIARFRREVVAGLLVTGGGGLISLIFFGGWQVHRDWLEVTMSHHHNQGAWRLSGSVPGLAASLLDSAPAWLPWAIWMTLLAGIFRARHLLFSFSATRVDQWAMAVALAALTSPYLLHYDLVFLIPLALAARSSSARWSLWGAGGAGFLGPNLPVPGAPILGVAGVWLARTRSLRIQQACQVDIKKGRETAP